MNTTPKSGIQTSEFYALVALLATAVLAIVLDHNSAESLVLAAGGAVTVYIGGRSHVKARHDRAVAPAPTYECRYRRPDPMERSIALQQLMQRRAESPDETVPSTPAAKSRKGKSAG